MSDHFPVFEKNQQPARKAPFHERMMNLRVVSFFCLTFSYGGVFLKGDAQLLFLAIFSSILLIYIAAYALLRPQTLVQIQTDDDFALCSQILSLEDMAVVVFDKKGQLITGNKSFKNIGLAISSANDLLIEHPASFFETTILEELKTSDDIKFSIVSAIKHDGKIQPCQLLFRQSGSYVICSVVVDQDAQKKLLLQTMEQTFPVDLLNEYNLAVALENYSGHIIFACKTLRQWLNIPLSGQLPSKFPLSIDQERLFLADNTYISVVIHKIPITPSLYTHSPGHYYIFKRRDNFSLSAVSAETDSSNRIGRQEMVSQLINSAPIAIAITDVYGTILQKNAQFQTLFDVLSKRQSNTVTKTLYDFIADDYQEDIKKLVHAVSKGRSMDMPHDMSYKSEELTHGQIFLSSFNGDDDQRHLLVYCFDKTQEKNLELQFVQAQKMQAIGQLAGGVAHDFNNLLTAILGFCDLLLMRHLPGDQSFSDINQIKQNANRAANLVRQLLAFSRQQTLRPVILNIGNVISDVSNLIRRLIGENIKFTMNLSRDIPEVRADQGQLEQVMINLAVNARDAMETSGELTISTRHVTARSEELQKWAIADDKDFIAVSVADTGSGISPEIEEKIFDPFFTTKKVGEGTGLGLSTVYGIVKQTGGYIYTESKVGVGTIFHIYLPCYDPESDPDDTPVVQNDPAPVKDLSGKGLILLVEDEAAVRMFASRALKNKGYDVLEADSGEKGLEILIAEERKIDLLITDVIMPNMDGPTLYKHARKNYPEMPVIFVSGYAEDVFRKDLEDENFDFLPKPFSLNDLAEKVKNIL